MKVSKKIAAAAVIGTAILATVTACGTDTKAPPVGQNVSNLNQVQNQNENETIQAYNEALKNVENQYPASQMANPLELKMLRERDLYLNDENQLQYIYIFPTGRSEVFMSSVKGKISSLTSQMTATDGVWQSCNGSNCSGGGNVPIPMPQDDLSYGGSPCGDQGIFWFDAQGGFHTACMAGATYITEAAPLKVNAIEMPAQPMDPAILAKMKQK